MTRQQKIETQLRKEIRKLERDNFALTRENDRLKREIKVLTTLNQGLDGDLASVNQKLVESETLRKKILDEVHKYTTTNSYVYLRGK